ncbi:metallophosphoesterase [uncultured Bacteroides sp.]|uniref:metallophosphoesterase n=1 Tax=uncultured Bacteroides sp. TaxID=162156 RepID=UPI003748198F
MISRMFLPFVLLLFLPDLYIYNEFVKGTIENPLLLFCYGIPCLFFISSLALIFLGRIRHSDFIKNFIMLFFSIVVPKVIFTLTSIMGKLLCHFIPNADKVSNMVGLVLGALGFFLILYGFLKGYKRYVVRETSFASKDLPEAFDGYRIVQFSDMHIGTLRNGLKDNVQTIVDLLNSQQGDIIVFTGDLVNTSVKELDGFEPTLSQLKAKDGVYSVLGNHDYGIHGHWETMDEQAENLQALKEKEVSLGWRLLLNENEMLYRGDNCIALVGVENDGRHPYPEYGNLPKAMEELSDTAHDGNRLFKVLLSHDPTHWKRKVLPQTDIQLMLAGHTHGMQFRLGNFSPSKWLFNEWGGFYEEDGRSLHVSLGLGSVMSPFRLGAWPEINVITLHKE